MSTGIPALFDRVRPPELRPYRYACPVHGPTVSALIAANLVLHCNSCYRVLDGPMSVHSLYKEKPAWERGLERCWEADLRWQRRTKE
jgi:hypothetical protein